MKGMKILRSHTLFTPGFTRWGGLPERWGVALRALWYAVGPFVVLLILWWIAVLVWNPGPTMLPSPADVAAELWRTLRGGILLDYAVRSLARLLLTALVVIPVAVALGLLMGLAGWAGETLLPVFRYFTAIPAIAWLPVFLVGFGFSETSIIGTAVYSFLFPVLFNTLVGVQTVPGLFRHVIRTLGGGTWRVIRDVLVPGALPGMATGVRLGFGYGWRALIAAEMLVAQGGLGHMLFKAQSVGMAPRMIAGMATVGILAAAVDYFLLEPLEEMTVRRWGTVRT
jgi:taurine transport system permease protein